MASWGNAPEPLSSDLLVRIAPGASHEVLTFAQIKRPFPSVRGWEVGAAIHMIGKCLEVMQPFQLPSPIQELSHRALQDIFTICKWPPESHAAKNGPELPEDGLSSPSYIYNELVDLGANPHVVRTGIQNFVAAKVSDIMYYNTRFLELLNLLDPDNQRLDGAGRTSLHSRHLGPPKEYVYPDYIRENLIRALEQLARCLPTEHGVMDIEGMNACHPSRLCLSTKGRRQNQLVEFDCITAISGFEFWQEFTLSATVEPNGIRRLQSDDVRAGVQTEAADCKLVLIRLGDFCGVLEWLRQLESAPKLLLTLDNDCNLRRHRDGTLGQLARSCGQGRSLGKLLEEYDLTTKDKIMLSFAIARNFWEFYGSEMTNVRWCTNDIWLMPRRSEKNQKSPIRLEFEASVAFPFGENIRAPDEPLELEFLTHRYPRILSLGIILLEIGRGRKLGISPLEAKDNPHEVVNDVNNAHACASSELAMFKGEFWDACTYKTTFDTAVANCLDHSKFTESPNTRRLRSQIVSQGFENLSPQQKEFENHQRARYQERVLTDRREAIYSNVVAPLHWLAMVGNDGGKHDMIIKPRVRREATQSRWSRLADDSDREEIQGLWKRVRTPEFNSGSAGPHSAEKWFVDLRAISNLIYRRRRLLEVRGELELPPVRIALLDTGCNMTLESFQHSQCFKAWKDFVIEQPSSTSVDEYGHGTFMARLVVQIIPHCELYIARVARTSQELLDSEERVAEAIRHAVMEWKVDIVSMSFSFPQESQAISDAIYETRQARKDSIIFLAGANNDVNGEDGHPACDPSVISMNGAESDGTFLPFLSRTTQRLLGTYGGNIPTAALDELRQHFPEGKFNACTSVATAVAAGIAGQMLAYATLLGHVMPNSVFKRVHKILKTTSGMQEMLHEMAYTRYGREHFINPIRFWSERADDSGMFIAMCKIA